MTCPWPPTDIPVVISYSGGASSEWMIQAVLEGLIPRPEHLAVAFADTGWEHQWTYDAFDEVAHRCDQAGIPVLVGKREKQGQETPSLEDALLSIPSLPERSRLDHPPFWLSGPHGRGRASHRCTREYKVAPLRRVVSRWLREQGLPKRVTKWIGFAKDEASRAQRTLSKLDVRWERVDFPALRLGRTRAQQRAELEKWTGRAPRFSMCVGCPFKGPDRWRSTPPDERERACQVDEAIRDSSAIGLDYPAYLSDRLIPVKDLLERGDPQPALPGLQSYCDGGACFL